MLKKISQILLILVLLVSTVGMNINMHFCQQKLYDIAVFKDAADCCAPKTNHHEKSHHCKVNNHHKNDCEDETIPIDKVDSFIVTSFNFDFQTISLSTLFTFITIYMDLNSTLVTQQVELHNLNISPPKIQAVLSLLQTYLI